MIVRMDIVVMSVAVTLLLTSAVGAVDLYRSNAVGIQGERINESSAERPEYVLEVSREGALEVRTLLHDGEETERVELIRDGSGVTERVYEDGVLRRESVRNSSGDLQSERYYSDGQLTERSDYAYEEGLLTRRRVYSPEDTLLYVESYSYWRNGTLRSIVKEEEGETRTEYRYRDARLEEEWISRPGESERFEFDATGRLAVRELYRGTQLVEQEVRLYRGAESGSLLREVVISAGDIVTTRTYDDRGRFSGERVEENGLLTRELVRVFSEDLLVSEIETDAEGERRWLYSYDEEGERIATTYRENGELVEIEHYDLAADVAPADRMTELYNRGQLVLRIYYDGRTRLREEVVRDGEVIRVRDFVPDPEETPEGDQAGGGGVRSVRVAV